MLSLRAASSESQLHYEVKYFFLKKKKKNSKFRYSNGVAIS